MISRRSVLLGATAAGAALLMASRSGLAAAGRFANPLRIPPLLEGVPGTDGKIFDLNVASGKSEFLSGISTPTLGINGAYLGPSELKEIGIKSSQMGGRLFLSLDAYRQKRSYLATPPTGAGEAPTGIADTVTGRPKSDGGTAARSAVAGAHIT